VKLWVMRHAYAGDFSEDPKKERERPLKPEGVEMAKAVAGAMSEAGEEPKVIFASPFVRTTSTADIVGKALGIQVNIIDDLAPNRPLEDRVLELMGHDAMKRIMIVGHVDNTTPALDGFGSDDGSKWKDLVMAEVRRLKIDRKTGAWRVKWGVKPSDLGLEDHKS
jgi:phosphohistidine phosphatase SixA